MEPIGGTTMTALFQMLGAFALLLTIIVSIDAHARQGVERRMLNHKKRIQQGVNSGELTGDEAKRLRKNERQIRNKIRETRKEDGGKLTQEHRREIQKDLNAESKEIYGEKHDAEVRPKAAGETPTGDADATTQPSE